MATKKSKKMAPGVLPSEHYYQTQAKEEDRGLYDAIRKNPEAFAHIKKNPGPKKKKTTTKKERK